MNTDTLAALADATEDRLLRLHNLLDAHRIVREEFIVSAVAVLLRAKANGVALADLALSTELTALWGRVVVPLGLELPDGIEYSTTVAVEDIFQSPAYAANAAAAVAVMGRSETLAAAQDALSVGMASHDTAWTRVLNEGACELCRDLAGDVLPATARMYHHKGCGCSQRPVTTTQEEA